MKTELEQVLANQEAAKAFLSNVSELTKSVPKMIEDIKALKESGIERFKDLEPDKVIKTMEELQAGYEQIRTQIGKSETGGIYLPGLYDYNQKMGVKRFSILRTIVGVKSGGSQAAFEKVKAGYEWEVMSQIKNSIDGLAVAGIGEDGGFFIPDQVIADLIQQIFTRSKFIDLSGEGETRVTVIDGLVGGKVTIPKFDGGVIAYWVGENDDFVASKANVGNVTMTPKKMGILTKLTDEMRKFASFGFENLLRRDMVRAASKEADRTLLYGSGSENEPRGVVNIPGTKVFRAEDGQLFDRDDPALTSGDWQGGELDFDGLDEMRGALEDQDLEIDESYAYGSAPRYFRRLKQLKVSNFATQTTEKPYLLGSPMLRDETLRNLIGDFAKTTQIKSKQVPGASLGTPTTNVNLKYGDVFGANWSEVLFGRWSGMEVVDDGGTGADFIRDVTNVKLRLYADVGHRQEKGIVICPDAQMRN